jgi:putative transposase
LPRLQRLHVPGGYYHVYARGNGKQDIFLDSDDRLRWEQLLRKGLQQHNHQVHAYCWMTNHVHIAIQAGEKPLSRFIGSLLSRYAKEFNRKTGRSGHVFERRHGAILVQDNSYLLELVRYIHQNPQRAGIVNGIGDYRWSSHHAYMGNARTHWLSPDTVLSLFGPNLRLARRQYVEFVGEKQPPSVVEKIRNGSIADNRALGDETWLNEVLRRADAKPEFESLDQLIDEVCDRNGVTEIQLASPSHSHANARLRAEIALVAMDFGLATMTEIARRFRRSLPVVSSAVSRLRSKLQKLRNEDRHQIAN